MPVLLFTVVPFFAACMVKVLMIEVKVKFIYTSAREGEWFRSVSARLLFAHQGLQVQGFAKKSKKSVSCSYCVYPILVCLSNMSLCISLVYNKQLSLRWPMIIATFNFLSSQNQTQLSWSAGILSHSQGRHIRTHQPVTLTFTPRGSVTKPACLWTAGWNPCGHDENTHTGNR